MIYLCTVLFQLSKIIIIIIIIIIIKEVTIRIVTIYK